MPAASKARKSAATLRGAREDAYDAARARRDDKRGNVEDALVEAMNRYRGEMTAIENAYFTDLDAADKRYEAAYRRQLRAKGKRS